MKQFFRFLTVGVFNTLLGYSIIFACMYLAKMTPESSNVAGYGFGLFVSYFLHRNFTFKSKQRKRDEVTPFLVVFLIAYASNFVALIVFIHKLSFNEGFSQILAGVVYVGTSFIMNKYYVFEISYGTVINIKNSWWRMCRIPTFDNVQCMKPSSTYFAYEKMNVDNVIDNILIVLVIALLFSLSYHPYFFGDELPAYRLAIVYNHSFASIFQGLNANKPRLIFNGICALLAKWEASRLFHAMIVIACMAWINLLLYNIVRFIFEASRGVAWLLVATILSSRYGMMLYFDYLSGLIETLSTALFVSMLLLSWLAMRYNFKYWYASGALVASVMLGLVHERYMVGSLAVGCLIAIFELVGAKRRISVVSWALSLGVAPLLIYSLSVEIWGSLPITTVGGVQRVMLGKDTIWCFLTYCYNVLLGGNYGENWFWGRYNFVHVVGKYLGIFTMLSTLLIIIGFFVGKGIEWKNRYLGLAIFTIVLALIGIASLAGSVRNDPRFMFPVGILVLLMLVVMLKNSWRYVAIGFIFITNMTYFLLGSHDDTAYITASRSANSIASSLQGIIPNGRSAIVVGVKDNSWIIGGGHQVDMGIRRGDTFSILNLRSGVHIDPLDEINILNEGLYDFGLVFDGFNSHRVARYRMVSVSNALILGGRQK